MGEPQFTTHLTPSGIEVLYQWDPVRLYKVRQGERSVLRDDGQDDLLPASEWFEVPSVTTVLGVLDKPGLPWWGMTTGIEGCLKAHSMGMLRSTVVDGQPVMVVQSEMGEWITAGVAQVTELLTKLKLTTNHVRDKAGDRGTAVHDALETWARDGVLPDPRMFPAEEQGYVVGLLSFLQHAAPTPDATEVTVGSLEHGFAGRYDLRMSTDEDRMVIVHRTPVRGPQWKKLPKGRYLIDLKTSKDVYPTHAKQLEGYELASIECGYEPTDARGVLNVNADGTYKFVRSWAVADDFLATLGEWRSEQSMAERRKQTK